MTQVSSNKELSQRLLKGIRVAQKRMLIEKALHGRTVIISDEHGNPIAVKAADILAKDKEYFDSLSL